MEIHVRGDGTLRYDGTIYRCALGRAGIVDDKREGDGGTPAGVFPLRRLYYRPDRLSRPQTALPVHELQPSDGWCDDPDRAEYNRRITLPFTGSHEEMWRDDALYDLVIEIGQNDDPPVPGRGSAVFIHVAQADYGPTAGCVALAKQDLAALITSWSTATTLRVYPPSGG